MNVFRRSDGIPALLQQMRSARVTVFGDFCLDAYWGIHEAVSEVSLETGIPVRRIKKQRYQLGGAGCVLANLTDLGVRTVRAIGLAGTDLFGCKMRDLLGSRGADISGFVFDPAWETMVYAKPCLRDQEESRIDFGSFNTIRPELLDLLLSRLDTAALESDVVVLNQQIPTGISAPAVIGRINAIIAAHPNVTFLVDARHYSEKYQGATLKLNIDEAAVLLHEEKQLHPTDARVSDFALRISEKTGKTTYLTRGEFGIAVATDGQVIFIPGLQIFGRIDTVGAGDAVVAALSAALACGASPADAAALANIAAMITVKKLQTTGTASGPEILAAIDDLNYLFQPELAKAPQLANYLSGTEIEVIGELPDDLAIRHCIFDHDGTLSVLREGWERIMEQTMMQAVLGSHFETAERPVSERALQSIRQLIERTTGMETLLQMSGLIELIREFGFASELEIRDEHYYKDRYCAELRKQVKARVEKLEKTELAPCDFQIKNAAAMLEELHRRGVKLYMASGSDEADALLEAESMGYAHLFEGRIFGRINGVSEDAKEMVIRRIIRENNLLGHEFATFSDGPVGLRETRRRGGLCIGVASDELRRFGLNVPKRKKLIQAGANLIVADFSQLQTLLNVMQIN